MIPARHLMDPWRDTLLTELRLAGVPGERIGEALAEVDDFCTESGRTPDEAFGDPAAYAQAMITAWAPPRERGIRRLVVPAVRMFATLSGVFALLGGVSALAGGDRGVITAGQLLCVGIGTVTFPAVIAMIFHPALFRRGPAWAAAVVAVPLLLAVPVVLWPAPVVHASGWVLLTGGLFLLAAAWWPAAADRVIDPRTGREPFSASPVLLAVIRWFPPVVLLVTAVSLAR